MTVLAGDFNFGSVAMHGLTPESDVHGEVLDRPETLQAKHISDHSAVAVTLRIRAQEFIRMAVEAAPLHTLEPWVEHQYFKSLMVEAAHFLARDHIDIDCNSSSVSLVAPEMFHELSNAVHSEVSRKKQIQLQEAVNLMLQVLRSVWQRILYILTRSIFKEAQRFAHFCLKVPKCCIVPVGGQLTPALVERFRTWLARNIPEWADFEIAEFAQLARVFKVPYCAVPHGDWFDLHRYGGPKVVSVLASNAAQLIRMSKFTIHEWRGCLQRLEAAAAEHLPLVAQIEGRSSATAKRQARFVRSAASRGAPAQAVAKVLMEDCAVILVVALLALLVVWFLMSRSRDPADLSDGAMRPPYKPKGDMRSYQRPMADEFYDVSSVETSVLVCLHDHIDPKETDTLHFDGDLPQFDGSDAVAVTEFPEGGLHYATDLGYTVRSPECPLCKCEFDYAQHRLQELLVQMQAVGLVHGLWFNLLTTLGSVHSMLFAAFHMEFFLRRGLTAVQVAMVHSVFVFWNPLNDIAAGFLADEWVARGYGTRLSLVAWAHLAWAASSLLAFQELPSLPTWLHYAAPSSPRTASRPWPGRCAAWCSSSRRRPRRSGSRSSASTPSSAARSG
ncbi:unnamed protein product [Prorocentrum cordatum]|uniref:Uncharacterized protein n=1 Tax=Prorocentrum cordatum TaxID=2364126 RepID=A0ABN9STV5_9DINO|nr:unnamed protein product [Polarella glacialis]